MEVRWHILLVILGGAIVTWCPRVMPLVMLKRFALPKAAERFLTYVPVSVMATLFIQEVLMPDGKLEFSPIQNPGIVAALLAFLVAWWTRSLIGTVVVGVAAVMLLNIVI